MVFFGKKKVDVLDLSDRYRRQEDRKASLKESIGKSVSPSYSNSSNEDSAFSFLGSLANNTSSQAYPVESESGDPEERKRKFAKRLMDMTTKIEDLSNQIYHLQQRVEVLDRKADVSRY